jgi:threonyl-tRNA synthetase
LWLAPVQLSILTVTEQYGPFAHELAKRFEDAGLRVKVDDRNEKIGYKIREARGARDSYIVVVGEKEAGGADLPVRSSKEGEIGEFAADALIEKLTEETRSKAV